ncbi:hypothetical protein [Rubellimicrobium thermophilum]|uniref:hypothetical protein n=1 Tax=Rubellimicrobium thermophilum TaxID=295419 RepID=UPI0003F52CF2
MRTVNGLHHVTTLASDAQRNEAFWRGRLGLRRVKVTVNFDAPEVYHLYFGTGTGDPGSLMTAFPFPCRTRHARGRRGRRDRLRGAGRQPALLAGPSGRPQGDALR